MADFSNADLTDVTFAMSSLAFASFEGAKLQNVEFKTTNLRAANFLRTELGAVRFSDTTCADGMNSDDVGGTCEGGHI